MGESSGQDQAISPMEESSSEIADGNSNKSQAANSCLPLHLDDNQLYGRDEEMGLLYHAYENSCLRDEPAEEDDLLFAQLQDSSRQSHTSSTSCHTYNSNRRRPRRRKRRSSMVIITGPSGLGKTALARTLQPKVEDDNGWFLYGKCNQIPSSRHAMAVRPYAPFAEAFSQFVDELLLHNKDNTDSKDTLDRLQRAVFCACQDTSVSVLTDTIPALQKVVPTNTDASSGLLKSSSAITVGGTRTGVDIPSNVVFCKFLQAFCSRQTPLVLFVDDLQWLDASSLSLFQAVVLAQGDIAGLLVVGTCRGNEVSFQAPLAETLRTLEDQHGVAVLDIAVHPLTPPAIQDWIVGLLGCVVPGLVDLVMRHTGGIPFFALQFLRNLYETRQLRYDGQQWVCDAVLPDDVLEESQSDDDELDDDEEEKTTKVETNRTEEANRTVEYTKFCSSTISHMIQQHNNLALQHVLMVAACLGTEFSLAQIAAASGIVTDLDPALQLLVQKGMLLRRKEPSLLQHWGKQGPKISFRWSHDRFQTVAFEMIPESTREEFHVAIGLNLLRRLSPLELQQQPFVAMHQFCWCNTSSSIPFQSDQERTQLATLCLAAGQQAALSSAFEAAATYLQLGLDVIGSSSAFAAHYDLTLSLFNAAAEMEGCLGNFDKVDQLVAAVWEHATSFRDTLQAYETQIYSLGAREELDRAIQLGLQCLQKLGIVLPRRPRLFSVIYAVLKTKRQLAKKSADDIMSLYPLQDWKNAAALRIMHLMISHANRVEENLSVLLATRGIQITLKHGLSEMACFGFYSFGLVLVASLGAVDEGIRVAEMASAIQEKSDSQAMKCRAQLVLYGYTKCWTLPITDTIQPLQDAARYGALSGDTEMSCLSLYCASCASFLSAAATLDETEEELADLNDHFSQRHQDLMLFYLRISQQTVQNLRGSSNCRVVLSGDFFDEEKELQHAKDVGNVPGITLVYLFQCYLAVYFNDSLLAKRASKILLKRTLMGFNLPLWYQVHFVGGLAEVDGAKMSGKRVRQAGKASLKSLMQLARHQPDNVMNKVYLIEAERLATMGQRNKALEKYRLSIEHAKKNNFVHEEALASERAGLSLIGWGETTNGAAFLERARWLYEKWGCTGKVCDLSSQEKAPANY
ncbi:Serine threonine kinase with two-component sensor domain [Seminavis robusta]|uniref:Serine threonine kinase with two-component sensor domain n=1 Tax=Seminavis robusta TaxID=568900 RepID=A0A9N8H8X9_9STRA|nr:Serine threonine kinase with two-component sensor domain [Seminavis robusta]|eukprot:Sro102_g052130.1 Serine threonine kinase with two-component sensor domain (1139) ;mRNA; r:70549-74122